MAAKKADPNNKTIAENRRARFDYAVEDTFEAGIVLCGTEVKALREGRANIAESYVAIEGENARQLAKRDILLKTFKLYLLKIG